MTRREGRAAGNEEEAASGPDTQTPAALCELGRRHLEAGRTLDAQLCCQQALATDPGSADAMHLMGLLSLRAEQADQEWLKTAAIPAGRSANRASGSKSLAPAAGSNPLSPVSPRRPRRASGASST